MDEIIICLTTDSNVADQQWFVYDDSFNTVAFNNNFPDPFTTYYDTVCVDTTEVLQIFIDDLAGDGIDPPGGFAVLLNGDTVDAGPLSPGIWANDPFTGPASTIAPTDVSCKGGGPNSIDEHVRAGLVSIHPLPDQATTFN